MTQSQLSKSIDYINSILANSKEYEDTWVIADDSRAMPDQIAQIWKRRYGKMTHPVEFFDHIVSDQYFGVFWPSSCDPIQLPTLTKSPADYVMFIENDRGLPSDQWIPRHDIILEFFKNGIKQTCLPGYHSLKICAPETNIYELLSTVTALSDSYLRNDAVDRLFFDRIDLQSEKQFQWNKIPILKIDATL